MQRLKVIQPKDLNKSLAGVMFVLVIALAALIWVISSEARRQIDTLATASSDRSLWTLSQAEIELLSFENSLLRFQPGDPQALGTIRRNFDVFYARIETLKSGYLPEGLTQLAKTQELLGSVQSYLKTTVAFIDASDDILASGIPEIVTHTAQTRSDVRELALDSIRYFSEQADLRRTRVADALSNLRLLVILMFLALVGLIYTLVRLAMSSRAQANTIAQTQNRLSAIVATSQDAVLVINEDGNVIDYNGAAEEIFGYAKDEAMGQPLAELIVPHDMRDAHLAGMERFRKTREPRVVGAGLLQLQAMRKGGELFPAELSIASVESRQGTVFVSYIRDISDRVKAEADLTDARDQAVAGEQAKAKLLAVMSHEMRTPLNGILGTLELLQDTPLSSQQSKYTQVISRSGQMLLGHVNDVLDISSYDAGQFAITQTTFDLEQLIGDLIEDQGTMARERGNSVKYLSVGNPVGAVRGDRSRISQIVMNLLSNAIKFTKNGSVTIEVERHDGSDMVEIRVADDGVGMDEEAMAIIFDDFVTLDPSFSRSVEGTGLGLGIAQRLVRAMKGEIGVESEAGVGSVFWFSLPLPAATQDDQPVETSIYSPQSSRSGKVLVVEDNKINRLVVRDMLSFFQCDVVEAENGKIGVERAQSEKFDLILMDISMPEMDGVTATQILRSQPGPNESSPIIAMTAHAAESDMEHFRSAGMNDVITKPLSKSVLLANLNTFISHDIAGIETPSSPMEELKETLGNDHALEIARQVLAELRLGRDHIKTQLAAQKYLSIADTSHKLSGSAAIVGLTNIVSTLNTLEIEAKASNHQNVEHLLAKLSDQITEVEGNGVGSL